VIASAIRLTEASWLHLAWPTLTRRMVNWDYPSFDSGTHRSL